MSGELVLCNRGEHPVCYSRSTVYGARAGEERIARSSSDRSTALRRLCDSVKTLLMRTAIAAAAVLIAASLCFAFRLPGMFPS
jgi:hypothetical protein